MLQGNQRHQLRGLAARGAALQHEVLQLNRRRQLGDLAACGAGLQHEVLQGNWRRQLGQIDAASGVKMNPSQQLFFSLMASPWSQAQMKKDIDSTLLYAKMFKSCSTALIGYSDPSNTDTVQSHLVLVTLF